MYMWIGVNIGPGNTRYSQIQDLVKRSSQGIQNNLISKIQGNDTKDT